MKTYTKAKLAAMYAVHRNTFAAYLRGHPRLRHLAGRKRILQSDLDLIQEILGPP